MLFRLSTSHRGRLRALDSDASGQMAACPTNRDIPDPMQKYGIEFVVETLDASGAKGLRFSSVLLIAHFAYCPAQVYVPVHYRPVIGLSYAFTKGQVLNLFFEKAFLSLLLK